jgi:CheY-like chemotaxis protein
VAGDAQALIAPVQDALEHLYDYAYLQARPLAGQVVPRSVTTNRGGALHSILVETIERLKPPAGTPHQSQLWRRHRIAFLRYVEGMTVSQIAHEINVSERQARRDHHEAVAAIAQLIADRLADGDPRGPRVQLDHEVDRMAEAEQQAPTHVAEVVHGVVDTLASLAESKGIAMRPDLPPDLTLVSAERSLLRQVLLNQILWLLEGATPGHELHIGVEPEEQSFTVVLTLPGGSRNRVQSGERAAVADRLTRLFGGTLAYTADSNALRVRLTVPTARPPVVLLVDDNPDLRRLFKRYLGGGAYRVVEASRGDEAIKLAVELRPDAITLDVMMPSNDGWEVLQTLRGHPRTRGIPIVVCSVLKEQDLAGSLGAAAFLPKPVSQAALLAALARLGLPQPAAAASG